MKKILISLILISIETITWGQTYYMDLVDGTTQNTCSGYFVDSDLCNGASYTYCDNENYVATFCSPTPGEAIRFDFTYLQIEDGYDFFSVYDGASTASPLLGTYTGVNPDDVFPWAFVGESGCLTFEFISDNIGVDVGWESTISCWAAPTSCNGNDPAGDDCINATEICNLNGYCGNTSGWYSPDAIQIEDTPFDGNGVFCGSIENNSWLSFIASGSSASFTITSSSCTDINSGIQAVILETSDCNNFTLISDNCLEQDLGEGTDILSANGLIPGNKYYIMVDGFAGNVCDYTVTANTGVLTVEIESSAGENLCPSGCTDLTAIETGATSYSWSSVPAGASGNTPTINVCPLVTTTYYVQITGICGGTQTAEITINVGTPTIDFVAQSTLSNLGTSDMSVFVPSTVECDDAGFYLVAEDSVDANNYITPALLFNFVTDGYSEVDPSSVNIYQGGPPGTGSLIYSENPISNNTTLQVYPGGGYMSPTGDYYVEICDGYGDGGIDYEISDGNTAAVYASGSVTDGNPCEVFGPFNPAGNALWSDDAPAGSTASWDDGIMYFDPSTAGPGTYTFTYDWSDGAGCSGTQDHTIQVINPNSAAWNAPNDICENITINLNTLITGTTGGSWSGTGVSGSTFDPSGLVASSPIDITYTVASATSCEISQTYSIIVNDLPSTDAGSTQTVDCNNPSISLTGTGGGNYSWTTTNGNIVSGASTSTPTVNSAGTYTLLVTDGNGCQASDNVTVNDDFTTPTAGASVNQQLDCNITSATLTGTGGGNYSWSTSNGTITGGTTSSTATASSVGTYTVTVTAANGCTDTDNVTVSGDYSLPSANAGSAHVIDCNNPSVNLTATGGGTYAWTTTGSISGASNTASVTATTAGTYTVTVTGTNGCSATDDASVTENTSLPNANAGTASDITCTVTSVSLDGSASTGTGISYNWVASSGGNIVSGASTAGPSVNATGTYTLTVTGSNGCTDTDIVTVQADAGVPAANAGSATDLTCTTTSLVLDGTGSTGAGLTYDWTASAGGNIVSGGSSSSPTINAAGTYTLEVTASNGCTSTDVVIVNEDATLPTVNIAAPSSIDCANASFALDASTSSQGANYTINWTTTGNITSGQTTLTPIIDQGGNYTLEITNTDNGCTADNMVTVSEDLTLPNANAGSNQDLTCAATSLFLDGSASSGTGISYLWTGPGVINGSTTASAEVNQAGQYTLTVTGSNGCTDIATVDVIPDANLPTADAGNNQTLDCVTSSVTLDGSGSDAGMNYTWTTVDGNIVSGQGTTTLNVDQNGTYVLEVANTSNGCTSYANVSVSLDTITPTINITVPQVIDCNNPTVLLEAQSTTGITFAWSSLGGNIVAGDNSSTSTVDEAGTYEVEVTANNGCSSTDQVVVSIDTLSPVANAGADLNILCSQTEVTLDGSGSTLTNVTYSWTTSEGGFVSGEQTLSPVVNTAGSYFLEVTAANGCIAQSSVEVTVLDGPMADFEPSTNLGQVPLEVYFDNVSTGDNLTYNWDFGDDNYSTEFDPTNTYTGLQTYVVTLIVTDENGCIATHSDSIVVEGESGITIPNIFTPNGDAENDIFYLTHNNLESIKGTIMNRWGQVMFEWNALDAGWDGRTLAGINASEGAYYYIINATGMDGQLYDLSGTFQLVR